MEFHSLSSKWNFVIFYDSLKILSNFTTLMECVRARAGWKNCWSLQELKAGTLNAELLRMLRQWMESAIIIIIPLLSKDF